MNQYTEDEIQQVLQEAQTKALRIKLFGMRTILMHHELTDIFYKEFDKDDFDHRLTKELRFFIFEEPFENVPLFINDYPAIASWRLRIGK